MNRIVYEQQENEAPARVSYMRKARSSNGARPGFFWLLFVVTGLLFGLSVAYAIDGQTARHWRNLAIAGTMATTIGLVVLYHRMKEHDSLQWTEVEYERPAPAPPVDFPADEKRELAIQTNRGAATIVQPRPGAFAAWLREVVNPDTRTTFSRNEAKRRDWEEWQYINLVAQLKAIGWLHLERTLNGAPDVESGMLHEIREWLKGPIM